MEHLSKTPSGFFSQPAPEVNKSNYIKKTIKKIKPEKTSKEQIANKTLSSKSTNLTPKLGKITKNRKAKQSSSSRKSIQEKILNKSLSSIEQSKTPRMFQESQYEDCRQLALNQMEGISNLRKANGPLAKAQEQLKTAENDLANFDRKYRYGIGDNNSVEFDTLSANLETAKKELVNAREDSNTAAKESEQNYNKIIEKLVDLSDGKVSPKNIDTGSESFQRFTLASRNLYLNNDINNSTEFNEALDNLMHSWGVEKK